MRSITQNFLRAWKNPRWRWALVAAALSDVMAYTVVVFPPAQWGLDAATAVVLFAVLGPRWPLVGALAIEVVPGMALFPAWTLVVASLAGMEKQKTLESPASSVPDAPPIQKQYRFKHN